jgi:hypothetical protein
MPDISKLVIEVDSKGVMKATGDLEVFSKIGQKAGQSTDGLAQKFGAFQLIVNKLPGPLKSVASGLMGMVSPATAAVSAITEVILAQIQLSKESEEAYIKQEVSLARLGAVLEATGAKTWTTTSNLKNMADSIRQETGRSTDEIMRMQSVLLGFTGITGENFERLTRNMINMADVMGGDLAGSANIFGKALENPSNSLNALTRQGFVFTEEQKRMVRQLEEAGRLEEAQVIYLEAMERAFGDSAKATREAAAEINNYKQALEDLKLARGEFEASGGMTWNRFWREFWLPGIEDQTSQYREETQSRKDNKYYEELNRRADEVASNYLQTIKTAEELIAIIESGKVDINDLYRAVMGKFGDGSKNMSERLLWQEGYNSLEKYKEEYDRIQKEIKRTEERFKSNIKDFEANKSKIEIAYDDTSEGKHEKLERDIQKWKELRDRMWEVDTGVFEGLSDEYKRQIDVIIANLQKQLEGANKVKVEYADWVKVLAQATGYSDELVNKLRGLGTIEKYAADVQSIQNTLLSQDGNLIKALGLDQIDVLESSANKVRSVLEAMLNSGEWDGTEQSIQSLVQLLNDLDKQVSDIHFDEIIAELDEDYKLGVSTVEERVKNNIIEYLKELGIINPTEDQIKKYRDKKTDNLFADLAGQLEDAGKSTYDLALKRLRIEYGISEEAAKQVLAAQKQIDYITNGYDYMGNIMTQIDDALRSIRAGEGGYGQYAGARAAQSGMEMIEGSDVGNFIQGFQEGGIWGAIIETLIGALVKVIGGMEELEKAMNPVTEIFSRLEDVINFLHEIIMQVFNELIGALTPLLALIGAILQAVKPLVSEVIHTITGALDDILSAITPLIVIVKGITPIFEALGKIVRGVFDALRQIANAFSFGLFDKMNEWADTIQLLDDEQQKEADRLRALNDQYKRLYDALKEQEEYYLQQRRHLNAEWAVENYQNVNDMILSPHGAFSTDPKDYIIATKHPESLMNGGSAPVYVTVINNSNASISTQESTTANGAREIQVIVEGVVQNGFANGKFDSALDAAAVRRNGKRVSA